MLKVLNAPVLEQNAIFVNMVISPQFVALRAILNESFAIHFLML